MKYAIMTRGDHGAVILREDMKPIYLGHGTEDGTQKKMTADTAKLSDHEFVRFLFGDDAVLVASPEEFGGS